MKTKIFSILLCLLLAFTLVFVVACGNKDEGDDGNTNTNTDTSTDTATDTSTDTNTDTSTDTSTDDANTMHTVTFVLDNGEENVVRTIRHDSVTIGVPVNITKAGYTFAGWTADGEAWDAMSKITADITVTAVWTANENVLVYNPNCTDARGTMASDTAVTGGKITLATNAFTRTGYIFKGWATTENGEVAYENGAEYTMGTEAQNQVYAVWEAVQYSITYELESDAVNNPENPDNYTVANLVTFKNPTREGWNFKGWRLDGAPIIDTAELTGGITLTAVWERPRFEILYRYNDLVNGLDITNVGNPLDMNCDETHTLVAPACNGYNFDGWYSDAEFTTPITELTSINATTEIFGKFSLATYTITYETPAGVTNNADNKTTFTVVDEITLLAPTVDVTGYEFDSWYIKDTDTRVEAISAGDYYASIELVAVLKPTIYTITYSGAQGLMPAGTVVEYTVESEFTKITLPTLEITGITFNGWYSDEALENAITEIELDLANPSNITVYLSAEITKYTITYVFPEGIDTTGLVNPNADWYAEALPVTFAPVTISGYKTVGFYSDEAYATPITTTEGLTENITVYVNLKQVVEQIGKDQVLVDESTFGTNSRYTWEKIFDGNSNTAGGWYVDAWALAKGQSTTLVLDEEYLISSIDAYIWSNGNSVATLEFFDAEGNSVAKYNWGWTYCMDGAVQTLQLSESIKVKSIVYTRADAGGNAEYHELGELIMKVDND